VPGAAEYLPGLFTVRGCGFVATEHFKFRLGAGLFVYEQNHAEIEKF
jgi:hypothetical protein